MIDRAAWPRSDTRRPAACGFNLFHRPDSWFDLFSQREQGPPPNLAEWQAASAEIDARCA
jgi:hypothetical protein